MAKRKPAARPLEDKTCKELSELLLQYVNQELSASVKDSFDAHLKICPDCVSFLNTYRKTISTTQSVPVEAMPKKARANLLAFLRQRIRKLSAWLLVLAASF